MTSPNQSRFYIYAYATKDTYNGNPIVKIGQATQRNGEDGEETVSKRIGEQNKMFMPVSEYFEVPSDFGVSKHAKYDHKVHQLFEEYYGKDKHLVKGEDNFNSDEAFIGTIEDVMVIRDILRVNSFDMVKSLNDVRKKNGKVFVPRISQAYYSAVLKDIVGGLNGGVDSYILELLCARFGKVTFSFENMLWLNRDFGKNLFIVSTAWLSANSSFVDDHKRFHASFGSINIVEWDDPDFISKVKNHLNAGEMVMVTVSLHAKSLFKNNLKVIQNYNREKKVVFVDEADFACGTKQKKDKINLFNSSLNIIMSGTGKTKISKQFSTCAEISCSYIDNILIVNRQSKIFFKDYLDTLDHVKNKNEYDFCKDLIENGGIQYNDVSKPVNPHYYMLKAPESFESDIIAKGGKFTSDYADICQNPTEYETQIEMLCGMFDTGYYKNNWKKMHPKALWNVDTDGQLPACIGMMAAVPSCKTKENLANLSKVFEKYMSRDWVVGYLCGDNTSNAECQEYCQSLQDRVVKENKLAEKNGTQGKRGYIVFTMTMGSRSFSMPWISFIYNFYDKGGMDVKTQRDSRVLTPGVLETGEHKRTGKIIELSMNPKISEFPLTIQAIADYIQSAKRGESESNLDCAKRIFKSSMVDFFEVAANGDIVRMDSDMLVEKSFQDTKLIKEMGICKAKFTQNGFDILSHIDTSSLKDPSDSTGKKPKNQPKPPKKGEKDNDALRMKKWVELLDVIHTCPINLACIAYDAKMLQKKENYINLSIMDVLRDINDRDLEEFLSINKEQMLTVLRENVNPDIMTAVLQSQLYTANSRRK